MLFFSCRMGVMVSGCMYCTARKRKKYHFLSRKVYAVVLEGCLCAQIEHCPKTNIVKASSLFPRLEKSRR